MQRKNRRNVGQNGDRIAVKKRMKGGRFVAGLDDFYKNAKSERGILGDRKKRKKKKKRKEKKRRNK